MTDTSPGGRVSVTSCHTARRPKDLLSPSTTTSIPISPPGVAHRSPRITQIEMRTAFSRAQPAFARTQPHRGGATITERKTNYLYVLASLYIFIAFIAPVHLHSGFATEAQASIGFPDGYWPVC